MLRDADPSYFNGIYIVCGYTDLRYGIDSLSAIIKQRYKMSLFVPNTLFLFCGHSCYNVYINLKEPALVLKLSEEQLNSLNHDALVIIAASLQDQLISVSEQLDKANAQLANNNQKIDFLACRTDPHHEPA